MSTQIQTDHFTNALYALLDETFDNVRGYYLDKGTSMFETLATISAEEASVPVGGQCATLAAQVKHVVFYLDVLEKAIRTQQFERQDWDKIWRETSAVTPEEWNVLKSALRESYNRIKGLINDKQNAGAASQEGGVVIATTRPETMLGDMAVAVHPEDERYRHLDAGT